MDTTQKLLHPGEKPPMAGLSSHVEKKRDLRKQVNHHLYVTLTEFSYPSEDLEVYFSLYSTKENNYVSEKVANQRSTRECFVAVFESLSVRRVNIHA